MTADTELWREAARHIHWFETPTQILDDSDAPFYRWFPDGVTNACYNALDRHMAQGRGDQVALLHDSPLTNTRTRLTYSELLDAVSRCAGGLRECGVAAGDRVLIYLPMVPEAVIAMLACARLGAVHSVVFGGFASRELALRIDDAEPRVIITATCGLEPGKTVQYMPLLEGALEQAKCRPAHCVVLQRPQCEVALRSERDIDWHKMLRDASPADCVAMPANAPLYILYTSGTTGQPKGVVRDTGGSIVALNWSMSAIYDCAAGDVYWAASDVGWVVGHSYIVYGPLFAGCTTVMFEGKPVGTPDAGAFWRVVEEHKVNVLFTAPTAFRAIRKEDPRGELLARYDIGSLRALFLAGERCDPSTLHWAQELLGIPVVDHWWQTETGWPICANCLGIEELPIVPGSPGRAVPGYTVRVLDTDGEILPSGEIGALVVQNPLPPGTFTTLWNGRERFVEAYFARYPGYYETGDVGYIDDEGNVFVMSRTDDVINTAGHRLSTGALEEVLAEDEAVAECAVIGVHDPLKGEVPVGLLVVADGAGADPDQVVSRSIDHMRERIGPVAAFRRCAVVARLPKTRSGKILRGTLRAIANGDEWTMPATIDDASVLDEVAVVLKTLNLPPDSAQ